MSGKNSIPIRNQRELEMALGIRPFGAPPNLAGCPPPFTSDDERDVRLTAAVEPQAKKRKKGLPKKK
jgi:hypothetical protein